MLKICCLFTILLISACVQYNPDEAYRYFWYSKMAYCDPEQIIDMTCPPCKTSPFKNIIDISAFYNKTH